jgi:hypothetical protein
VAVAIPKKGWIVWANRIVFMEFVFAFMDSSLLGMNVPILMCSKQCHRGDYVSRSNNAMVVPDVSVENANALGKIKFINFGIFISF